MYLRSVEGLNSPDFFAAFHRRAGFVLKSPFLVKEYSERERAMLDAISQLPKGDYSANVRQLKTTYPHEQLDELVRKVMQVAEGRRSLASTVKESPRSSRSSSQEGSISSEEPAVSPRLHTKVNPVVGEPKKRRVLPPPPVKTARSPARSPSPPKKTPPAPARVASPTPKSPIRTPLARERTPLRRGSPRIQGTQTPERAASPLIQGGQTPLRIASPPESPLRAASPGAQGMQTPLRVGSPPAQGGGTPLRAASPGVRTPVRATSPVSVPPVRGTFPMKKQRSFIESGSALDLLKIQREYEIAVQGAICLKFLFPEAHSKLFPKEDDRRMVDAVIRSHGLMRFVGYSRERAVDEAFKNAPKELFSVLHRLGKQQTLSQIAKPPTLKDFPPLAPIFFRDPRLGGERLVDLVQMMGKVRYQCLGIYTTMPEPLRRGLNCFCAAVFIQEMIGWPLQDCLQVAFRGKYPTEAELDRLVREVTLSDSLSPVEMAGEEPRPERAVEEVFAHPFLKYPILFRQLLKHLAQFRPEDRHSFFGRQIEAVYTLKEQALLSHDAAVKRCFARSALEKHFVGEGGVVEKTLAELDRLSPHPAYDHPLLRTVEGIALLREKSQGDLQGYFKRVQDVMGENPGMPPFLAVQAVFTRFALRLFFESDKDNENGSALVKLIEEASGN